MAAVPECLAWEGGTDGYLRLLDQTLLPTRVQYAECRTAESVWEAIRQLRVRGAPAIGIAAAYGVCLGVAAAADDDGASDPAARAARLRAVTDYLASSRPTAVNLFWALDRMQRRAATLAPQATAEQWREALLDEARRIHAEDRAVCHAIGRHGAKLIEDGWGVLTHCNAGGLATSEYGTALSVLLKAHQQGKRLHVFVDETRPLLQGARLTAWELLQHKVPSTLICDSMAAQVMKEGRVQAVITGADRIAANGDSANKIGTYGLAVLAQAHGIPFYIAAPTSTFDLSLPAGDRIPIEERPGEEITKSFGQQTAPAGIHVYNPAFDVTPARFIRGIITEFGCIEPVTAGEIRRVIQQQGTAQHEGA
jgi:methylthioribose-1-phosphate isomerase